MKAIFYFIYLAIWISGVVIAKGFWSTFFALIVPFWGWYLVAEALLLKLNIIH